MPASLCVLTAAKAAIIITCMLQVNVKDGRCIEGELQCLDKQGNLLLWSAHASRYLAAASWRAH